ncbi:hypothetical protein TGAM01_v201826 [Trichoderma gamsii]|uniref:N-acetyltransferase domain-containing protein n=1 Tax=Trichoderma gamsii TaxID=398673 RepID=A0A2P4ZZ51_9HYPO|nr:hypothetical protein TGAM01_v201826 [Trichoderma gamsii]PON29577.1 hypothetical protein TGAM01_v201826 [Trichoderma gamsii]
MSSTPGIIVPFELSAHSHLVPYLAALHASCITHDHTIATFLLPLSHEKLLAWWKERIGETNGEKRVMLLLVSDLDPNGAIRGPEIKGVVMLWMPYSETGSFRGFVENLLVHKSHRGKGGAKLLDTESGSQAEAVFKTLGYTELGKVPGYGMSPAGGLKDGTFFYKTLQL